MPYYQTDIFAAYSVINEKYDEAWQIFRWIPGVSYNIFVSYPGSYFDFFLEYIGLKDI